MDCKIIKFFLLIFFISFKSYAVEFNGKFIQGHYIIGKTDPNSIVTIDKIKVKVSKDGYFAFGLDRDCLLYTSPSPRDRTRSRMPSSA